MAAVRTAHTVWNGNLMEGSGNTTLDSSGLGTFDVTWKARTEQAGGQCGIVAHLVAEDALRADGRGLATREGTPPGDAIELRLYFRARR